MTKPFTILLAPDSDTAGSQMAFRTLEKVIDDPALVWPELSPTEMMPRAYHEWILQDQPLVLLLAEQYRFELMTEMSPDDCEKWVYLQLGFLRWMPRKPMDDTKKQYFEAINAN